MKKIVVAFLIIGITVACKKEDPITDPADELKLAFTLEFDETLPRLDNFGNPIDVAPGNAAQHPNMKEVSVHYIEFAQAASTPLTTGAIVYKGQETEAGGENAVNFDEAPRSGEGESFLSVNLSTLPVGTYKWLRVSLTYQKYNIAFRYNEPPYIDNQDFIGTLSSFVGFNTYIISHMVDDSTVIVNNNKLQGYWAFETNGEVAGYEFGNVVKGDGAGVTVVNPLSATSPVPAGSCVVTGELAEPLVITGNETEDVNVVLAFSINNSFEWEDTNPDGKYEPAAGETVVDMGLRGLYPRVE